MQSIKKILFIISLSLCFMNMQCHDDDSGRPFGDVCDITTIIDQDLYENLNSANFTFIGAEIINDCLYIEIGASGCDGSTWGFKLVDSGAVAESLPEQRYLRFQLTNEELCAAYFERTITFDIKPLQVIGSNEIILHIEGLESSLSYKY